MSYLLGNNWRLISKHRFRVAQQASSASHPVCETEIIEETQLARCDSSVHNTVAIPTPSCFIIETQGASIISFET